MIWPAVITHVPHTHIILYLPRVGLLQLNNGLDHTVHEPQQTLAPLRGRIAPTTSVDCSILRKCDMYYVCCGYSS